MCIFVAELLAYTWSRVQCTRIGYEISKATVRNRSLTTDQDNLAIELARLKSPQRIEKIATSEMNIPSPSESEEMRNTDSRRASVASSSAASSE